MEIQTTVKMKMIDFFKKYKVVIFVFVLIVFGLIRKKIKNDEINDNLIVSVAKGNKIYFASKRGKMLNYIYLYEGKIYEGNVKIRGKDCDYLNKFFEIHFSSKDPRDNNIFIRKKISDKEKIKKAGF